jgi:hypothetical protein
MSQSCLNVWHLQRAYIPEYLVPVFHNVLKYKELWEGGAKSCMIIFLKGNDTHTNTIENQSPITFLETIKKIYSKTIFIRITQIWVSKLILKNTNTSYYQTLLITATCTHESSLLNKPISQNMNRAFSFKIKVQPLIISPCCILRSF